jgi:hypothetical protein
MMILLISLLLPAMISYSVHDVIVAADDDFTVAGAIADVVDDEFIVAAVHNFAIVTAAVAVVVAADAIFDFTTDVIHDIVAVDHDFTTHTAVMVGVADEFSFPAAAADVIVIVIDDDFPVPAILDVICCICCQ